VKATAGSSAREKECRTMADDNDREFKPIKRKSFRCSRAELEAKLYKAGINAEEALKEAEEYSEAYYKATDAMRESGMTDDQIEEYLYQQCFVDAS
jgi:hypothetical protein